MISFWNSPLEIVPGIHRIDGVRGCRVYLLVDDEGMALVDTGLPGNAKRIAKYLASQGISTADLRWILLTHGHPDHTGSVRALRRIADVRVLAHDGDMRWDAKGRPWLHYPGQPFALPWDVPFLQKSYADEAVEEGASLPILGGLTVLHIPGHTPGSVAFFLERKGVLFTGDTLLTLGGRFVRPFPFLGTDFRLYRSSVERLASLEFDIVCPGHGRPLVGRATQRVREMLQSYLWAASGLNRLRWLASLPFGKS